MFDLHKNPSSGKNVVNKDLKAARKPLDIGIKTKVTGLVVWRVRGNRRVVPTWSQLVHTTTATHEMVAFLSLSPLSLSVALEFCL